MLSIAGISLWSFLLLMQAYMVVPGSFGGELSVETDNYCADCSQIWVEPSMENTCALRSSFLSLSLKSVSSAVSYCALDLEPS
jgi:proton-coupled amino acid transporter